MNSHYSISDTRYFINRIKEGKKPTVIAPDQSRNTVALMYAS